MLSMTLHEFEPHFGSARAWKGLDWDAMNRLHEKGLISDPRSKAKSVVLSKEAIATANAAFDKLFRKAQIADSQPTS